MVEKCETIGNAASSIVIRLATPGTTFFTRVFSGNGARARRGLKDFGLRVHARVGRGSKNLRLCVDAEDVRGLRNLTRRADDGVSRVWRDLDFRADGARARQRSTSFHLRCGCEKLRNSCGSTKACRARVDIGPTDQMSVYCCRDDITDTPLGRLTRPKISESSILLVKMLMAMATTVEASRVAAPRMGNSWDVNRELFDPRGPTNMQ